MKKILTLLFIVFAHFSFGQNEFQHANMNRKSAWQKSSDGITRIEITFENPEGNENEIQIIKNAVLNTWGKYANIQFTNWGKSSYNQDGIRIRINHIYNTDMDIGRPHTKGLGKNLDGVVNGMELNPEWIGKGANSKEDCLKFTAVHEFGHALGLAHEQNRPDYKANCNCYQALEEGAYQADGGGGDDYLSTPCDENSVMNYCNKNWNNGGKLSNYDILGIQTVYGTNPNLLRYQEREHIVNIIDNLGTGQTWENLYVVLGNEQRMLHVDLNDGNDISKFYNKSGNTYYRVWSRTLYNGREVNGYGEGYIFIPENTTTTFEVFIQDDINQINYGRLTLQRK